jgi:hypothetical protein
MSDTPDTDAVDPDVLEQHAPISDTDEGDDAALQDADHPLSADEIEQRRSVDYADDEY